MKVLIRIPQTGGRGGIETVTKNLLNSRFSIDNEVILVTESMMYDGWLNEFPSRVKQYRWTGTGKMCRINFLHKIYKENPDIDVIIDTGNGHQLFYNYVARKISKMKSKLISWYHVSMDGKIASYSQYFRKCADYYLAISSGIEKQLMNLGIVEDKIYKIYNMVPTQRIYPLTDDGETHFIYVGRIDDVQKNISELLRGFKNIDKSKYHLDIYGVNENKESRKKQHQLAKDLDLNITWHGWQEDPWAVAEKNGINYLIMTSNYEGFPMVLLEAISRGIPVISSNCVSGPEDIVTPENGYLYELHNMKQLEDTINDAIDHKLDWNQKDIQNSIEQCYTEQYIQNLEQILNQIVSEES